MASGSVSSYGEFRGGGPTRAPRSPLRVEAVDLPEHEREAFYNSVLQAIGKAQEGFGEELRPFLDEVRRGLEEMADACPRPAGFRRLGWLK
jgi:hypothetical protein